ncbi:hypothetical protein EC991_000154 [Linnemannia zychae]|nr:hypothetical protein EC991_000154 [Linnemannia zychae]
MLDRVGLYPELAEYISKHLAHADLFNCVRVSRNWHAVFIRHLWETFSDHTSGNWFNHLQAAFKNTPLDGQDMDWFVDVYTRHVGFIRHLELCHPFIVYVCLFHASAERQSLAPKASPPSHIEPSTSIITRLKSLTIKHNTHNTDETLKTQLIQLHTIYASGHEPTSSEKVLEETCWQLARCNPRLEFFDFTKFRHIQKCIVEDPTAQTLRALKTMTMDLPHGRVPRIPPSVTRLNSSLSRKEPFDPTEPPGLTNDTLEELYIRDEVRTTAHIKSLLIQLPSLRYLRLRRVHLKENDQPPAVAEGDTWTSDLRVLLCGLYERKSPELVKIFPWMPNLVEFHHSYVSSPFTAALAKHCPLLEVIRVNYKGCRYTPRSIYESIHDRVSILLTSCTRLRVLDLQYETIDARCVAEKPWVCLDLEMFRCGFVGLPYLSDREEQLVKDILQREEDARRNELPEVARTATETELLDKAEEGKLMRKSVLQQVSLLTSLKHLTLSRDLKVGRGLFSRRKTSLSVYTSDRDGKMYFRYNDVLPDTLHLRLDTGLKQLASLVKLELFGFESIDHRMGSAEIEWIAKTFPTLKEVRGLAVHTQVGAERDLSMDALRELMQSLRPDIVHSSSFTGYERQSTAFIRTRLSPLELPHIVEAIFSYLSQFVLRHCVRLVCKQWRAFAAPLIDPIDNNDDVWSDDLSEKSLQGVMARLERKTILRIQIRMATSEAWIFTNWAILLETIQTLRTKSLMRIQRLHLAGSFFPETRFYPLLPMLSDTLTEIRIERTIHVETYIGTILALCPWIRIFHISCGNSTCKIIHTTTPPWPGTPDCITGLGPLRLEDLKIKHMHIEQTVLETIITRSPHLRAIRLIEMTSENSLSAEGLPDRENLIQLVAESCPRLETFHYSANRESLKEGAWIGITVKGDTISNSKSSASQKVLEPIRLQYQQADDSRGFLEHYNDRLRYALSISAQDIHSGTSTLLQPIVNHLTRLEILSTAETLYNSPATAPSHVLHEYLCSSPLLEHLVAPGVFYRSEYMELRGDVGEDGLYQPRHWDSTTSHPPAGVRRTEKRVWACRRLQTLHIFFGSTPQEETSAVNSRTLFGYITRVCPDLRDLVIRKTALHVELEGGMCLLTRLHKLQRLTVASLMHANRFESQDIEWMAKTSTSATPNKESRPLKRSKRLSRLLRQIIPKRLVPGPKIDVVEMQHMHQLYLKGKNVQQALTVADMEGVGSDADLDAWQHFGQRYAFPLPLPVSKKEEEEVVEVVAVEEGEEFKDQEWVDAGTLCWPRLEFFGLTFLKHRLKSPTRTRLAVVAKEKAILTVMTQIRPEVEIRLDQGLFDELFSMS